MKRVICLTIWLMILACSISLSQSNNLNKSIGTGTYTRDTLTASVDTAVVTTDQAGENFQRFVLQAYTTIGADTLSLYTKSRDNKFYIKRMLIDSAGTKVATAIVGVIPQEWIINDSEIKYIELVSPSDDASTVVFIVAGKNY
jgi:hypothetical protein